MPCEICVDDFWVSEDRPDESTRHPRYLQFVPFVRGSYRERRVDPLQQNLHGDHGKGMSVEITETAARGAKSGVGTKGDLFGGTC